MKITKEHLHYIYADNNKSNRDKLSTICNSVGIKCLNDEGFKFIEIYSCDGGFSDDFELLDTDNPESTSRFVSSDDIDEMLRAAALEEKKPHTRVEYVKCEFSSDYEHLKLMIDGEKFYTWDGDVEYSFNGARFIGKEKPNHNMYAEWTSPKPTELYRRIETPITELDCFVQDCKKSTMVQDDVVAMSLFEAGCRFVN